MGGTMNPSTYQQVRENMERLAEFLGGSGGEIPSLEEIINRLETIEETVNNIVENPTGGGDVTVEEDGAIRVYGMTIVTQFSDTDIAPVAYTRDVTFELKKPSAVGLNTIEGFDGNYVLIATYKHNLINGEQVDLYEYIPQQVAYSKNMRGYTRSATDASSSAAWGTWEPVVNEGEKVQKQFIQSETEPDTQTEGDYWCEPLD